MKNKLEVILFAAILVLAFAVRFINIDHLPNGLQQDESSIGYNAYSILQTGKDEYGKSYPLFFKAFGEYKLPLSIYLTSTSFFIFGMSEFSLRFPSAFFGALTVAMTFFVTRQLFPKKEIALVSMVLLALNPWHIHFSRGAYEVTPALFFIVCGVYFYLLFVKNKSQLLLSTSLLFFGISMFGYNIARLFVPAFLLLILFKDRKAIFQSKGKMLLPAILFLIIIITFLLPFFSSGGFQSTRGTLIPTSAVVQASNLELRSYILEGNPVLAKVFFNSYVLDVLVFLKNVVSYINVPFFFINGSPHGNHGIGNVGQFYLFEIITILSGIIWLFKTNSRHIFFVFGWITVVILVASVTREAPHATRSFFLIPPLIILSALGMVKILKWLSRLKSIIKTPALIIGGAVVIFFVVQYFTSYIFRFPILYSKNYRSEDAKIVEYLTKNYDKYDTIFIDNGADLLYTSILFYSKFDPSQFQNNSIRKKEDSEGFSQVTSFGKYQYVDAGNIPNFDHSLLITTKAIPGFRVIKTFEYPTRPVVVANGQELVGFPVTDTAYVLLEKN